MNKDLAICIPTYNRAETVRDGLARLVPAVAPYGVPIYISDNASDDNTEDVVAEARARYPYVFIHRNAHNLGMDANFKTVLGLPTERFAWLLGDDDRIEPEAVGAVLNLLNAGSYDLVLVNGGGGNGQGRVLGRPSRTYERASDLLGDVGWHATWISSLILSRDIIHQMNFDKYIGSYFSHFGSLFEVLAKKSFINVYWYDRSCFQASPAARFSWASRALEIFSEKWSRTVLSLPDKTYSLECKHTCIAAHSVYTGLFSPLGLINLRAQGGLSVDQLDRYAESFHLASGTSMPFARLIAVLPIQLLKRLREIHLLVRRIVAARRARRQS